MQDFPANSRKAAQTRPDGSQSRPEDAKTIERVTSGEAVRRKRSLGRQFKETFIGGSARLAIEYMTMEVVIPAVKDMLYDAFQGGLQQMIYGDSRPKRGAGPSSYSNVGHVAYNRMSKAPPTSAQPQPGGRTLSRRSRTRQDFDEIVVQTRQEANEVIDRMFELLSRYGTVTVADLYELTGIQNSHVDYKWGWTELRGAKAAHLRSGGYLLDLPEPQPLD